MVRELLTVGDAGRLLNLTPAGVRDLIRKARLPVAARTPKGTYLLNRDAVVALAEQRAAHSNSAGTELARTTGAAAPFASSRRARRG